MRVTYKQRLRHHISLCVFATLLSRCRSRDGIVQAELRSRETLLIDKEFGEAALLLQKLSLSHGSSHGVRLFKRRQDFVSYNTTTKSM